MSIKIGNDVKNQGEAPAMITGLDASKPGAGQKGRLYYATDTKIIYLDTGTAWVVFINGGGSSITVTDKYIPVANGANTLVNSLLYQNSGSIALNSTDTTKGKLSVQDNVTRVIIGVVNNSTAGDDFTSEVRFFGYDGSTISPLGQVYQTNANQVTTSSFPNSLNLKAFRSDGKIVFIVGGNTSADIKGFINNSGQFIIGSLADNGYGQKLQVTGGVNSDGYYIGDPADSFTTYLISQQLFFGDTDFGTSLGQGSLGFYDDVTQQNATYSKALISQINSNTGFTNNIGPNVNGVSLLYLGSPYFQADYISTKLLNLNLGTYGYSVSVNTGFTLVAGSKNNRGRIQYTGGTLAPNTSVTCTITFAASYPSAPYGYATQAGTETTGLKILIVSSTVNNMVITLHNTTAITTIAANTIFFNYLAIL